jgi:molecular chaperone GrpE
MPEEKKNDNKEEQQKTEPEGHAEKKESPEDELRDRLLRLAAEFDNYKKRTAKEIENAKLVGKAEMARKLLSVLDEFELAMQAMKIDEKSDKGIGLVFSNFKEAFKKEGLNEIESDGVFDPYKHEIILAKGSKEKEGTIIEVVRKGYTLNSIMIRPASVIISDGKTQDEKAEKENKKDTK